MKKIKDNTDQTLCPVARAEGIVSDRWTVLILRELFMRMHRFEEIQAQTGATPQMIAARLKKLEADGLKRREICDQPATISGVGRELADVKCIGWADKEAEHGGRESRKKIPINKPLHGSMRRLKVVPNGCDFHVFRDRLLVLAANMLTPSPSIHDFVPEKRRKLVRLSISRRPRGVTSRHTHGQQVTSALPPKGDKSEACPRTDVGNTVASGRRPEISNARCFAAPRKR